MPNSRAMKSVTRAEVRIREAVLAFWRAVGEVEAPPQGHDMRGWSPLSYQMGIFDAAAGESFFSDGLAQDRLVCARQPMCSQRCSAYMVILTNHSSNLC